MGLLREHQADKSEESAANHVVGAAVGLSVGGTKGSQLGVSVVVGTALGLVTGFMLVANTVIVLGRKGCWWTTIAGNNRVIINMIVIVCQDLEGVVVLCQMLVHDR